MGISAIQAGCVAAVLLGISWNVRFAISDLLGRKDLPDSTRLAMRLMPADGAYPAQLADELFAEDPVSAKALLQRAVQLNRYDASSWIQLGLLSEAGNDLPQAEWELQRAADADATFLPSWTLANFYFRHENQPRFWFWAQRAARMAPDDSAPLFRLAWYVDPNVLEIEQRLQLRTPALESQFVNFLIRQGNPEGVQQAAMHLLASGQVKSTDSVLGACEWLIEENRPGLALPLWNGLADHHQIAYAPLGAGSGTTVTNGNFTQSPISRGFDWHLPPVDGMSSFLNGPPNSLGFEFTGDEPERFHLMDQVVPVVAQRSYALIVDYATSGISAGSGIAWAVTNGSGAELARTANLFAEQGGEARACFTVPAGDAFIHLSLLYNRQPGTVRAEGRVALQEVRLTGVSLDDCRGKKISSSGDARPGSATKLKEQARERVDRRPGRLTEG